MMSMPKCYDRNCIHYMGHDTINDKLVQTCTAFPEGIPDSIAYGEDLHFEVLDGQNGEYVYENPL